MTGRDIERTLVLGVGNPLMGDDGAGIQAVRMLADSILPENVSIVEAGTPGWGLVSWIRDWPSVIIVDAVQMGRKPGDWRRFDASEVRMLAEDGALSLHKMDLAGGLALAQALDLMPGRITIYGIEPGVLDQTMALSPAVHDALPGLVESIRSSFDVQADERKLYEAKTHSTGR